MILTNHMRSLDQHSRHWRSTRAVGWIPHDEHQHPEPGSWRQSCRSLVADRRSSTHDADSSGQYNTVYPAGSNQDSSAGTTDIIRKITTTLASSPNECFILEGYSQGAAATVNALSKLTGANFNAVKGVFLIGDPLHKSGLTCNVDTNGGTTTRNVNGISAFGSAGIPSTWVPKTLDVCNYVRDVIQAAALRYS